jgi:hypothetical protein
MTFTDKRIIIKMFSLIMRALFSILKEDKETIVNIHREYVALMENMPTWEDY